MTILVQVLSHFDGGSLICVNTRILLSPTTGVQRYLAEILKRSEGQFRQIQPQGGGYQGFKGHLWEQTVLPRLTKNSTLWSPSTTGPLLKSNQVITTHDLSPMDHPEWFSKKFAVWYNFIIPRIAKTAAHILTDSQFSKDRILHHCQVHSSKVTVIPLGVDPRFFQFSKAGSKEKLSLPSQKYFLSLGSLEPRKNLKKLLEAWSLAAAKIDADIFLVIAGEIGSSHIFSKMNFDQKLLSRVHFTGRVSDADLPGLYTSALGFVYPSLYEGFGLPPLEAMAAGVPVLASNSTSIPEVVGQSGILFNPTNIEEISTSIIEVASDESLRKKLVKSGTERARLFNWDQTAQETLRTLKNYA